MSVLTGRIMTNEPSGLQNLIQRFTELCWLSEFGGVYDGKKKTLLCGQQKRPDQFLLIEN